MGEHTEKSEKIEVLRSLRPGDTVKVDVGNLTCEICQENVEDITTLMDHLVERHEKPIVKEYGSGMVPYMLNTGFTCAYCAKSFDGFLSLNTHVFEHSPKFACSVCGQLFSSERLKKHFQRNHEKTLLEIDPTSIQIDKDARGNASIILECSNVCPFKWIRNVFGCPCCNFTSPDFGLLRVHLAEHPEKLDAKEIFRCTRPGDKIKAHVGNLTCILCFEHIDDLPGLMDHLVKKHMMPIVIKNGPGIVPYLLDTGFKCAFCGEGFDRFILLNTHVSEHYPKRACTECGELFSRERLKRHTLRNHGKTLQTKFKPNFSENDARRNASIILECSNVCPFKWHRNVFGCAYCSFTSPEFSNLLCHMSCHPDKSDRIEILRNTRPTDMVKADVSHLKCDLCQESVTSIQMLMDHLIEKHEKPLIMNNSSGIIPYVLDNEFTCDYCGQRFDRFITLNTHVLKHNINCKCSQCGQYFSSKERLRNHVVRSHIKPRKVPPRPKLRKNDDARNNAFIILENSNACPFKWHRNVFGCAYCKFTAADFAEIKAHVNTKVCEGRSYDSRSEIVKADVTDLKCNICDQAINNLNTLLDHLSDTHAKPIKKENGTGIIPYWLSDGFTCADCGLQFDRFTKLNFHSNEHYPNYICPQCGQAFSNANRLKHHSLKHTQQTVTAQIKCNQCDEVFTTRASRQKHMQWKHNKLIHKCPYCDEAFTSYVFRVRHLNEQHGKKIEYPCRMCPLIFETASRRAQHTHFTHLRNKRYACTLCEYRCINKSMLQRHMVKHGGEKKYKCEICTKAYPRAGALSLHMRIHNNDKRFSCKHCHSKFVQKCSLTSHMKTHHPHELDKPSSSQET